MARVRAVLRGLGPVIGPPRARDLLAAAAGVGVVLLICAGVIMGTQVDLTSGAFLIAPMGASAVILFALPNSPLAQPWSAVIGNSVSALVALGVHQVTADPALGVGLSAGLSVGAMVLTRSLHPPGGAVALTAALNPGMLDALGLRFVLVPVALGTSALVAGAMVWHRLCGRTYPFRQPQDAGPHATASHRVMPPLGLDARELVDILDRYRQSANLGVADLARLIAAAEQMAAGHELGGMTCATIMSRDLVTVGPDATAGQVADLFRVHGFTSIPVVGPGNRLMGVIFQLDLIRQVLDPGPGRVPRLLQGGSAGAARRASQIMSTGLPGLGPDAPAAALLPLLADGGPEAVPILEGERITGIVTRTDLLSALAHAAARAAG